MTLLKHPQQLARLRRLALSAQGLLQTQPFGRGQSGALKAITHIGYVQIDTISVVERAHHHVLHSRVPGFTPAITSQLLENGDIFEYWTHAAAFLPLADFRFSLPYKHAIRNGRTHWYKNPDRKLMQELLARIRSEGPIRSRDADTKTATRSGWWDWKPTKKALEQLYMEGDLMVCRRDGFQKLYDLTERVLPSHIDTRLPDTEEFADHIVTQQLRCHGAVSLKGLTYLRRNPELRAAVRTRVTEMLDQHVLEQVQLSSGEVFLLESGALKHPLPRCSNRLRILSPFDNSVIQRERLKALFHFDYQLECYLPAAKRQYGYFCLPLLYRDAMIGRMDCKVHRKNRHMEIRSVHFEQHDFDEDLIVTAFAEAVTRFCRFQQCDTADLMSVRPRRLLKPLRGALARSL